MKLSMLTLSTQSTAIASYGHPKSTMNCLHDAIIYVMIVKRGRFIEEHGKGDKYAPNNHKNKK